MTPFKRFISSALICFAGLLVYIFLPAECPEPARRTAFVFVVGAFFWALEIIPLYATSLLVVLLEILLLCKPGGVLGMDETGYVVFLVPFASPVIMLFFGGFIIAGSVQKYGLGDRAAYLLIKRLGREPHRFMFGIMCVTAFLSMWMSNTATTAMMLALLAPLLAKMPAGERYKSALVLSVAFAANIGGIGTPVGTPPNAIAMGMLLDRGIPVTFLSWMTVAIPLVMILLCFTAFILHKQFKSDYEVIPFSLEHPEPMNTNRWSVLLVVSATVVLWISSEWHHLPEALVALLAVGALAISGLVSGKDFREVDWSILILMWGGLALGKGMEISGLTDWVVRLPLFNSEGWLLLLFFVALAVGLSTVISNTAAANLIIPIAVSLPGTSALIYALMIAFSCSVAMSLPISTPPNALAFSTEAIKASDMFKAGFLVSVFALVLLILGHSFIFDLVF